MMHTVQSAFVAFHSSRFLPSLQEEEMEETVLPTWQAVTQTAWWKKKHWCVTLPVCLIPCIRRKVWASQSQYAIRLLSAAQAIRGALRLLKVSNAG